MSFVGLVTQKEKVTGVNLMAKVVTANKKKSAKKIFPVRVKASGLTDADCCIIDLATIVDKINAQNMNEITTNITLIYSGENGTTVSYELIDSTEPLLSEHLAEDGTIIKRPKYGEGNAVGSIKITVTKGNAAPVSSTIQAGVKAYQAKEVLADPVFTYTGLWSKIKGNNANGANNIASKLKLITTVTDKSVTDKTTEEVQILWNVVDNTLQHTNIYTEPRIDVTTGNIIRPTYEKACELINSNVKAELVGEDNKSVAYNRVRIYGVVLTATITLGDKVEVVKFECATISKYLKASEIEEVITNNIHIKGIDASANSSIFKYNLTSNTAIEFNTIHAPAEGGIYTLNAFGNTASETLQAPNLKLNVGDITDVSVVNYLRSYTNTDSDYADSSVLISAFNGGQFVTDGTDAFLNLTINLDELKDVSDDKKQFAIVSGVTINKYSEDGEVSGGGRTYVEYVAYFKVDTSSIVEPAVEPVAE